MIKWMKNKNGKYVPCKDRLVSFIPNTFSSTYYIDLQGNMMRGINHPNGCLIGYETNFKH